MDLGIGRRQHRSRSGFGRPVRKATKQVTEPVLIFRGGYASEFAQGRVGPCGRSSFMLSGSAGIRARAANA